jgi:cathepsin L
MKSLVVFLAVVAMGTPAAIQYPEEWHLWKAEHGVSYSDDLEELRKHITWMSNNAYIDQHNQYSDTFGYTLKMNNFGDLSSQEFVKDYMCVSSSNTHNVSRGLSGKYGHLFKKFNTSQYKYSLPDDIDWRTSGAVTSVKDQLRCSSSYAFAAIGALEGAMALSGDSLVSLSAQNLVDCSVPYGNHGCSCGNLNSAYLYIIDNEGIDSNYYYQYKSRQLSCKYYNRYKAASMSGVVSINSGDEGDLQSAVANVGPVSTYVDASHSSFQFYSEGIMDIPNCSRSKLTHAMVIIGYSSGRSKDYWLLKNSWGPNWGINGYIKMVRNKSNQCGVATSASFPTL